MNDENKILLETYESVKNELKNIGLDEDQIRIELEKSFSKEEMDMIFQPSSQAQFIYDTLIRILKRYMDMEERYYHTVVLWIMATYLHDEFITFPYLYINAEKGSGKTRLLQLIAKLARGGEITANMTEAVMFRLPNIRKVTLCVDEVENLKNEDKVNLRLLLDAAYKKGLKVYRMKKSKDEEHSLEEFEVFVPMAMANVFGLDAVLEDRCITMVLEKSFNEDVIYKMTWFDYDNDIQSTKNLLESWCKRVNTNYTLQGIKHNAITFFFDTLNAAKPYISLHKDDTISYETIENDPSSVGSKNDWEIVKEMKIGGRDLELWFPLMAVAKLISDEKFKETINMASNFKTEKMEEDMVTNRDMQILLFIFDYLTKIEDNKRMVYVSLTDIVNDYRNTIDFDYKPAWAGYAIKRLKIAITKRRVSRGIEYVFDYDKIKNKLTRMNLLKKNIEIAPESSDKIEQKPQDLCYRCRSPTVTFVEDAINHDKLAICQSCIDSP